MNIQRIVTPYLHLDVIKPFMFKDYRGEYVEIFNEEELSMVCQKRIPKFIQDDIIVSTKNVLRGYHGDYDTWKYIMCLQGSFQIAIVNIDPTSEYFMNSEVIVLDDKERKCILLPPKHVNAHMCLTDTCVFFYKQTTYYRGEHYQYSIKWDNFENVDWPTTPILSDRDKRKAKFFGLYINGNTLLKPEEVNL